MPFTSPMQMQFETISPAETLEQAAEMIGYDAFRKEQEKARAEGRLLGIGLSQLRRAAVRLRHPGHRGRDRAHRAQRQGQRLHEHRQSRAEPGDDAGADRRRRARCRPRRRADHPGRHGADAVRRGDRRQPVGGDRQRRGACGRGVDAGQGTADRRSSARVRPWTTSRCATASSRSRACRGPRCRWPTSPPSPTSTPTHCRRTSALVWRSPSGTRRRSSCSPTPPMRSPWRSTA